MDSVFESLYFKFVISKGVEFLSLIINKYIILANILEVASFSVYLGVFDEIL